MNTYERVKKWLAASLGIHEEQITPESTIGELLTLRPHSLQEDALPVSDSIIDALHADSLDMVELIMRLEEEWDIEVPDEEAESIMSLLLNKQTTVQQIVDLIDRKRNG